MSFSRVQRALIDENLMDPKYREAYIRQLARRAEQLRMALALNEGDLYEYQTGPTAAVVAGRLLRVEFESYDLFLVFQIPTGTAQVHVLVTDSLRVWPL